MFGSFKLKALMSKRGGDKLREHSAGGGSPIGKKIHATPGGVSNGKKHWIECSQGSEEHMRKAGQTRDETFLEGWLMSG